MKKPAEKTRARRRLLLGSFTALVMIAIGARSAAHAVPDTVDTHARPQIAFVLDPTVAADLERRLNLVVNGTASASAKPRARVSTPPPRTQLRDGDAQRRHESKAAIVLGLVGVGTIGLALASILFHSRLAPLTMPLATLHALVAAGGFVLLLACVYGQVVRGDYEMSDGGATCPAIPRPQGEEICHLPSM